MNGNGTPVGARTCALPNCGQLFTPTVYWQKCCCKAHAARLRYLQRKERVNTALKAMEAIGNARSS